MKALTMSFEKVQDSDVEFQYLFEKETHYLFYLIVLIE